MGVDYQAHDTKLDRLVTLRFLVRELVEDEGVKERFTSESNSAAALDPKICTVHDLAETDDGEMYIVMDHYEAG